MTTEIHFGTSDGAQLWRIAANRGNSPGVCATYLSKLVPFAVCEKTFT